VKGKVMRKYLVLVALLVLGACSTLQTTTVSTVKAQQLVDVAVAVYKADLRAETLYLRQPACGLPASPPPPLCASYAVGVKWKALDEKLKSAIQKTQTTIDTLGSNPTAVSAAVAALQLALDELAAFTNKEIK
jgi:hypothetical protein